MSIVLGLVWVCMPVTLLLLGGVLGALIERRRICSKLRQLPLSQEEFEYYLDKLGLDENPLDRRTPGEE